MAKGEPVWNHPVNQGTTLYLCLDDSQLRIQNRLFEITENAPPSVLFCTGSYVLGQGLEEQLEAFLAKHPDTVLVIIDTLQMIRGAGYDNTYANDYRDLSVLKKIADAHGIAILLIHHLRRGPTTCSVGSPAQPPSAARWTPASRWWKSIGAVAK